MVIEGLIGNSNVIGQEPNKLLIPSKPAFCFFPKKKEKKNIDLMKIYHGVNNPLKVKKEH